MTTQLSYLIASLACTGVLACGGTTGGQESGGSPSGDSGTVADAHVDDVVTHDSQPAADSGAHDAAPEAAPVDHGSPSSTYPAFTPDVGQIANNGGYVMKHPVIVPITWNSDSAQATFDGFADTVGGTSYWTATTSEYGVGAATSGTANHVHLATAAPTQVTDAQIQTMVSSNAGAINGWPMPSEDTIYAFFLPPGTSLQVQSFGGGSPQDACAAGEGGYHDQVTAGGLTTSYAVVPSCTFGGSNTAEQQSTMSMSHELIEAVTDPHPQDMPPGYTGFDANHFGWDYFQQLQSETGDACEFFRSSFFERVETTPAPFDAWVQRTWSNASIAAGHNPCVPTPPADVYFNVTPLALETVSYSIPGLLTGMANATVQPTHGIKIPSGKSATFAVGFYSDGPTSGPWTITATPGNPLLGAKSIIDMYNGASVTASVDKTSGLNGEKAYVTVNVATTGSLFAGEIVTITSTLGSVSHYQPIWIGAM